MRYVVEQEFSLSSFGFWSGAKSIIDDACEIVKQSPVDRLSPNDYVLDVISAEIESAFERSETVTDTDINDFVWFDLQDCLINRLEGFDGLDDLNEYGDMEDRAVYMIVSTVFKCSDSDIWER